MAFRNIFQQVPFPDSGHWVLSRSVGGHKVLPKSDFFILVDPCILPCFIPQINQILLWGFFVHRFFAFFSPLDFHNAFTTKKILAICL